jgi:hypothetical protein
MEYHGYEILDLELTLLVWLGMVYHLNGMRCKFQDM